MRGLLRFAGSVAIVWVLTPGGLLAQSALGHVVGIDDRTPGVPRLIPKAAIQGNYDYLFPTTPPFNESNGTFYYCLTDPTTTSACGSFAGTVSVVTPVGSPFQAKNFQVVTVESDSLSGTPVTLPVQLQLGQALVFGVTFSPEAVGQFTSSLVLNGFSFNFFGSTINTDCLATATTACLNYGRFAVSATWQTATGSGQANVEALSLDTANMWFFSPSSIEAEVKVIDGCGLGGHYWVFAGGLTNVGVTITVDDTFTGQRQSYVNPLGSPFQPIQATSAFSTCP